MQKNNKNNNKALIQCCKPAYVVVEEKSLHWEIGINKKHSPEIPFKERNEKKTNNICAHTLS